MAPKVALAKPTTGSTIAKNVKGAAQSSRGRARQRDKRSRSVDGPTPKHHPSPMTETSRNSDTARTRPGFPDGGVASRSLRVRGVGATAAAPSRVDDDDPANRVTLALSHTKKSESLARGSLEDFDAGVGTRDAEIRERVQTAMQSFMAAQPALAALYDATMENHVVDVATAMDAGAEQGDCVDELARKDPRLVGYVGRVFEAIKRTPARLTLANLPGMTAVRLGTTTVNVLGDWRPDRQVPVLVFDMSPSIHILNISKSGRVPIVVGQSGAGKTECGAAVVVADGGNGVCLRIAVGRDYFKAAEAAGKDATKTKTDRDALARAEVMAIIDEYIPGAHRRAPRSPFRLVLLLDEMGFRPHSVRALCRINTTLSAELHSKLGCPVSIVVAGTGVDGATSAPASDPTTYEIVYVKPDVRSLVTDPEERKYLNADMTDKIAAHTLPRTTLLARSLFTNARAAAVYETIRNVGERGIFREGNKNE